MARWARTVNRCVFVLFSVCNYKLTALQRLNMSYWNELVQTYFTEKATMKLTLWKDNQQVEAKPFGAFSNRDDAVYNILTAEFRNRLSYLPAVFPRYQSIRSQNPDSHH